MVWPNSQVGFVNIAPGSRIYRAILSEGHWIAGRDVTLPGRWRKLVATEYRDCESNALVPLKEPSGVFITDDTMVGTYWRDGVPFHECVRNYLIASPKGNLVRIRTIGLATDPVNGYITLANAAITLPLYGM